MITNSIDSPMSMIVNPLVSGSPMAGPVQSTIRVLVSAARTLNATGPSRVTLSQWQEQLRAGCGSRQEKKGLEMHPKSSSQAAAWTWRPLLAVATQGACRPPPPASRCRLRPSAAAVASYGLLALLACACSVPCTLDELTTTLRKPAIERGAHLVPNSTRNKDSDQATAYSQVEIAFELSAVPPTHCRHPLFFHPSSSPQARGNSKWLARQRRGITMY